VTSGLDRRWMRAQAQPDEAAPERAGGPGGRAARVPPASAAGFTLIELLVVVSVIALLAGLAAPAVGAITGASARKAAGELSGAMRSLFDTAALRHTTCRLALDLDGRAWWPECAASAVGIAPKEAEGDADLERRFPGEKSAELRALLARTGFGSFGDRPAGKRELPGSTAFGPVHVEGRRAATEGTVYLHFFPGGRAQRAYVPVADGKNLYTVVLEPFTGRARVVVGKVEVRE